MMTDKYPISTQLAISLAKIKFKNLHQIKDIPDAEDLWPILYGLHVALSGEIPINLDLFRLMGCPHTNLTSDPQKIIQALMEMDGMGVITVNFTDQVIFLNCEDD